MDLGNHSLQLGERLLWSDRPQRFSLSPYEVSGLLVGLVFIGFTASAVTRSVDEGRWPNLFELFAVIILVVAWGRVVTSQVALRSTTYLLTDRRVVIVSTRPRRRELSEYLVRLPPPVARLKPDGSGTISFGPQNFSARPPIWRRQDSELRRYELMRIELRAVPNAVLVRDLIATARERPS